MLATGDGNLRVKKSVAVMLHERRELALDSFTMQPVYRQTVFLFFPLRYRS
jgi:hypothetical protein